VKEMKHKGGQMYVYDSVHVLYVLWLAKRHVLDSWDKMMLSCEEIKPVTFPFLAEGIS